MPVVEHPAEEQEENELPKAPVQFNIESFGETTRRYFAVEFVGSFLICLLTDLFEWTDHFTYHDSFKSMNPGKHPLVNMTCLAANATASSCRGTVTHPLAGGVVPNNYMFNCLCQGCAFVICYMSAPGATIVPQFALMYTLAGLKGWGTLAVSLLGQLAGAGLVNFLMMYLLKDAVAWQTQIFHCPEAEVRAFIERMLGLDFPEEHVSNEYAFLYACMSGVMMVFLFVPMLHRCHKMHPFARDAAKGIAIAVFQAGFGKNGLGSMPNPSQWIASAIYLQFFGFHVWSKHRHYALIVPLWAPMLGICVGMLAYRVYLALLHLGKMEVPKLMARENSIEIESNKL